MTIQIEQQMAKLKKSYTEEELESFVRLSDRWLRKNENATFEAWADAMILQTLSLIDEEEPYWTFVAAQIYLEKLYDQFATRRGVGVEDVYKVFPEQLARYTEAGLYHNCLTTKYSELELVELASYLEQSRDELFTYIGLKTLMDRYVVRDYTKTPVELPQERWMVIAMTLMQDETENRLEKVRESYWAMSNLYMTVATPTLSNAGKTHGTSFQAALLIR